MDLTTSRCQNQLAYLSKDTPVDRKRTVLFSVLALCCSTSINDACAHAPPIPSAPLVNYDLSVLHPFITAVANNPLRERLLVCFGFDSVESLEFKASVLSCPSYSLSINIEVLRIGPPAGLYALILRDMVVRSFSLWSVRVAVDD